MHLQPIPIKLAESADRSYQIFYQSIETLPSLLAVHGLTASKVVVVTDVQVAAIYRSRLEQALAEAGKTVRWVELPAGEQTKSLAHLSMVYDALLGFVDRQTPIIALGGGVIGDLTGFAAASLLRGLPFIQLPTTLMAQVDSSIGGKTGINHATGKNLIGAFHQPKFILTDVSTVQTLPEREWFSGLAEVVKHALIADATLYAHLKANWAAILKRESAVIAPVIHRSAEIKAEVVSQDETEQGIRAHLNFGHTFGHAIEQVTGYTTLLHGEAVIVGMKAALYLSAALNPAFPLAETASFVDQMPLLGRLGELDVADLMAAMQTDKKAKAGQIRFVALHEIGKAYVTGAVTEAQVQAAWAFALKP